MSDEKPYGVIGIIDSYGAIHHRPLVLNKNGSITHDDIWPVQTHKRWRFILSEWSLKHGIFSDKLTPDEQEDVVAIIRKNYEPPLWLIESEEWEALGRPRSGKSYEKHRKKWDKIYDNKKSPKNKNL